MFFSLHSLATLSALSFHFTTTSAQESRAFDRFVTEPTFRPPHINITHRTNDTSLLAPGYFFYEPFALDGAPGSPIIFDNNGQLIWYGLDSTIHQAKNFRVCDYLGEQGTHLCWSEFSWTTLNAERARNRIFDSSYEPVRRDFGAVGVLDDPNPHEYNMLPLGHTYIHAVYQMKRMNLEPYGPKGGHIIDPCFQEVDVITGRPVFTWCGLQHFELWETIMFPHIAGQVNYTEAIAGDTSSTAPWDWAHINAVDKIQSGPSAGDFLISCRHHDSIYKIAGPSTISGKKPGTVLWRLGGEGAVRNDFDMLGNFTFSRQHHVVFHGYVDDEDDDGVVTKKLKISLFNNGWELRTKSGLSSRSSSGQILLLDETAMSATLAHSYPHPTGALAVAQGGMHVTSGEKKNAVVGWGTVPEISEFSEDGELLWHASFAGPGEKGKVSGRNYRAFKFEWTGRPGQQMKVVAYSRTCRDAIGESAAVDMNTDTDIDTDTDTDDNIDTPIDDYTDDYTGAGTYDIDDGQNDELKAETRSLALASPPTSPPLPSPPTSPPLTSPSTSSTSSPSPLQIYISWNGATLVSRYRIHISTISASGPWLPMGVFERSGFETKVTLHPSYSSILTGFLPSFLRRPSTPADPATYVVENGNRPFARFVSVQALDTQGAVLTTTITHTFVPDLSIAHLANKCTDDSCAIDGFAYNDEASSCAGACSRSWGLSWGVLAVVLIGTEAALLLGAWAVWAWFGRRRRRRRSWRKGTVEGCVGEDEDVGEWKKAVVSEREKGGWEERKDSAISICGDWIRRASLRVVRVFRGSSRRGGVRGRDQEGNEERVRFRD